ncbi:hypothetical protein BGX29_001724 [Mortierella sp. GBA35]|nr:hypothetical protein BGX29_001724 [Mortierella sp. GBA35]
MEELIRLIEKIQREKQDLRSEAQRNLKKAAGARTGFQQVLAPQVLEEWITLDTLKKQARYLKEAPQAVPPVQSRQANASPNPHGQAVGSQEHHSSTKSMTRRCR